MADIVCPDVDVRLNWIHAAVFVCLIFMTEIFVLVVGLIGGEEESDL